MKLHASQLTDMYIISGKRLRIDYKHWWYAESKWNGRLIAKALVEAGLAKPFTVHKDGTVVEIWCKNPPTVEEVERLLLTEERIKKLDKWIAKGVK